MSSRTFLPFFIVAWLAAGSLYAGEPEQALEQVIEVPEIDVSGGLVTSETVVRESSPMSVVFDDPIMDTPVGVALVLSR